MRRLSPLLVIVLGLGLAWWVRANHTSDNSYYLPYSGRIELDGQPVSDETEVDFTFTLSTDANGAVQTWQGVVPGVQPRAGVFSVAVGPVPDGAIPDDGRPLFLGVAVRGPGDDAFTFLGRQPLGAVPRAVVSSRADDLDVTSRLEVAGGASVSGGLDADDLLVTNTAAHPDGLRVTDGTNDSNVVVQTLHGANSGFQAINFNGDFQNGERRFNTTKQRWRIAVDQRDDQDTLVIDRWNGTELPRSLSINAEGQVGLHDAIQVVTQSCNAASCAASCPAGAQIVQAFGFHGASASNTIDVNSTGWACGHAMTWLGGCLNGTSCEVVTGCASSSVYLLCRRLP